MTDDLISRQAAIYAVDSETVSTNPEHFEAHQKFTQFLDDAEVSSFGRWQWANGFNTALTAVGIDLKKLPSAQQWIPCSERLPEENKAILLGVKYKDDFKMFVTARMDITYWQGLGRDIKCQEMRWMPLPEPWKGEDDD